MITTSVCSGAYIGARIFPVVKLLRAVIFITGYIMDVIVLVLYDSSHIIKFLSEVHYDHGSNLDNYRRPAAG